MADRDGRPLGVLVADDEEDIRRLMGLALRGEAMLVWPARCGLEAVELFRSLSTSPKLEAFLTIPAYRLIT